MDPEKMERLFQDIEKLLDAAYEEGFKDGQEEERDGRKDALNRTDLDNLQARFGYLQKGGEWQTYLKSPSDRDVYMAGFRDAMEALGLP